MKEPFHCSLKLSPRTDIFIESDSSPFASSKPRRRVYRYARQLDAHFEMLAQHKIFQKDKSDYSFCRQFPLGMPKILLLPKNIRFFRRSHTHPIKKRNVP